MSVGIRKSHSATSNSVDSTRFFLFSFNKLLFVPDMFEFVIVHKMFLKMFLKKYYFPPQMFLNVLEFDYTLSV